MSKILFLLKYQTVCIFVCVFFLSTLVLAETKTEIKTKKETKTPAITKTEAKEKAEIKEKTEELKAKGKIKDTDAGSYLIGIGDVLKINTWKEEDLTFDDVRVRNDGKITFPLLDDIQAAGRTTMDLKKEIETKLGEFVEAPTVTVTLLGAVSQKYYILGEVQAVGEYPLYKKLTVIQAFALAKGFTEWASKDEIILYRKGGTKEEIIKIDYDNIVKGKLNQDILLKADDIIVVP